jgi:orotidine-5'-phosphate decarboxylase
MNETSPAASARGHLAIALDTADLDKAISIAGAVQPSIAIAKVGLQLFSAHGSAAVKAMQDLGMDVFLDVKLHDIPNTVRGASKVLGSLGVRYLTVHASGGEAMLAAAVEGLAEGADKAGLPAPMALAVTVLTSEPDASTELLTKRLSAAVNAGCGGVICAATDLSVIKSAAQSIVAVVPGIRPLGTPSHDQGRTGTPTEAIRSGADILVIGRAVTDAENPAAAAELIAKEVSDAMR